MKQMNFIECIKNAGKIKILNLQSYLVDEYYKKDFLR